MLQTGVVVLVPVVAAAFALVAYFNWRDRLKSRIVSARPETRHPQPQRAL
jgi:hypothetical protein